jgi:hypothetical protein
MRPQSSFDIEVEITLDYASARIASRICVSDGRGPLRGMR